MKKVILFSPNGYVGSFLKTKLTECEGISLSGITRESDLDAFEGEYDILLYTASITSARKATAEQYIRDNALCTAEMMGFCKQHWVKRIIYLSTDEIYGMLRTCEVTEHSAMVSPNIYAATKYLAERVIRESGIPYYILRLPGIVGWDWGDNFIYRTMEKVRNQEDIYIYNGQKEFNNLVDIDDLAQFIWLLCNKMECPASETFVVGNCEKIKLLELVEFMKEMYDSSSEIHNEEVSSKRYFTLNVEKAVSYGYRSKKIKNIVYELKELQHYGR